MFLSPLQKQQLQQKPLTQETWKSTLDQFYHCFPGLYY